MPNAVYRPELCIRSTLEAARTRNFSLDHLIFDMIVIEYVKSRHLKNTLCKHRELSFKPNFMTSARVVWLWLYWRVFNKII